MDFQAATKNNEVKAGAWCTHMCVCASPCEHGEKVYLGYLDGLQVGKIKAMRGKGEGGRGEDRKGKEQYFTQKKHV